MMKPSANRTGVHATGRGSRAAPERPRWSETDALFQAVLDRPPAERDAYLTAACDGDEELRAEVESLLQASEAAEGFLEPGGPEDGTGPVLADLAAELVEEDGIDGGMRIGPYRVLRRLARGGMGTVFLAERADGAFDQRVALKVLRRAVDTEDVLRRFLAERQILASLDHPAIARLLDGGETEDGRPYLVMEWVDGQPIDVYCEERRLTIPERLELFATVAEAVHHAHGRLVIHRDLKPSNILVSDDGAVKLLDFGIAKLLEGSELSTERPRTRTGLQLLTPEYASPEQVRGDAVTTASDVYQLGVLLYCLLTGRPPYRIDRGSLQSVAAAVAHEQPTRPSDAVGDGAAGSHAEPKRLRRRLRGDLDTITLTALRKEPDRRYASADQLADDVRRHLEGLPIEARPATWRYQAWTLVRRHRAAAAAGAAAVVLLLAYLVTVTVYAERLQRERNAAQREAEKTEQVLSFMSGVLQVADPDVSRGNTFTVQEMLDAGVERAATELDGQPTVQARVFSTLADLYYSTGQFGTARGLAERALELRRAELGSEHPEVVESLGQLASTMSQEPSDSTLAVYERALDAAERTHGPDHPIVAGVLTDLGAYSRTDRDRSRRLHDRAIRILRRADGDNREQLADALTRSTYGHVALPVEIRVDRLREALALRRELHGPRDRRVAEVLSDMALNLEDVDPVAADTLLREAVDVHRETMGEQHPTTLQLMNNLAGLLRDRGDYAAAEPVYREVLRIREAAYPDSRIGLAYSRYGLGRVLTARGELTEGEPLLRQAAAAFEENDRRRYHARAFLARNLIRQERFRAAERVLTESWARLQAGRPDDAETRSMMAGTLATLYESWGRPAAAERVRERVGVEN